MTRARNVLVAERLKCPISSPNGVYGPTMKISSRPMTSGGSSRLHSTPASHIRGNGSVPRASIQASGVHTSSSTASVIPPDSAETISGSSAPGAVRELAIALPDRCVSSVMTGPSRTIQISSAPATDSHPEMERSARGAASGRPGCPGGPPPRTAPPEAAAGLAAQLTIYRGRNPCPCPRRRQQRESALLVLGDARRRQRVLDEGDRGRGRLADDGDVEHQRRAVVDRGAASAAGGN